MDFSLLDVTLMPFEVIGSGFGRLSRNTSIQKQGCELVKGIPHNNYPTRIFRGIHSLVRIGPYGVPSQATDNAKFHMACSDLTPAEINILAKGGSIIKNDVLIATSDKVVDGVATLYVSATNLINAQKEQYAVNELVTCIIQKCTNKLVTDAWINLQEIHKKLVANGGPL